MRIDDNVDIRPDGSARCVHCSTALGHRDSGTLSLAIVREDVPSAAGPSVHAPAELFTDRPIVFRQRLCPGCLVALSTEITPADEAEFRTWTVRTEPDD